MTDAPRRVGVRRSAVVAAMAPSALALLLLAPSAPAVAFTDEVKMRSFFFEPAARTIDPGDSIRWLNRAATPHTTTSDTGLWDSRALSAAQSFTFTFERPGVYTFHCSIHPSLMTGTITVRGPATPTPGPAPEPAATAGAPTTSGPLTPAAPGAATATSLVSPSATPSESPSPTRSAAPSIAVTSPETALAAAPSVAPTPSTGGVPIALLAAAGSVVALAALGWLVVDWVRDRYGYDRA